MAKLGTVQKGPNLAQKEFSQPGRHWGLPLPALCQYPGPGSQLRSEFLTSSTVVGILLDRMMPHPSSADACGTWALWRQGKKAPEQCAGLIRLASLLVN